MWIWLPIKVELTDEEQAEIQKAAMTSWLLYGELHLTNAPRGQGVTFIDPTHITYAANPPEPVQGREAARRVAKRLGVA